MLTTTEEIGTIFDGRYKLIQALSTDGATADVWLALDTTTIDTEYTEDDEVPEKEEDSGMLVAIKIYRPKNALDIEGEQRFRDEFKIAYECHHANLLQPTSFSICNGIPYLVLPYCKLGSSVQLIGKMQSTDEIWKYILDVSSGLERLHLNQPQIIHQDIKPANILIDNSHNFTITDFGISSQSNKSTKGYYDEEKSGTEAYMAPERFEDTTLIPASDIWSFGATLCEITTGKVPFGETGGQGQLDGIKMADLSNLPSSIRKLIQACLQKDPKKRPTASEIVKAARDQHFPIKRKHNIFIVFLIILLLAGGSFYYLIREKPFEDVYQPSMEEQFNQALLQIDSEDGNTALKGLHLMDSLSRCEYIPAMYEVAFTYGWCTDSSSWHRKEILGIKMDENKFPVSVKDRTKAKDLFDGILEISDTTYAEINGKAAYRLAMYFGDKRILKGGVSKYDIVEVSKYLDISERWATMANDTDLLKSIETVRATLNKKKQIPSNE